MILLYTLYHCRKSTVLTEIQFLLHSLLLLNVDLLRIWLSLISANQLVKMNTVTFSPQQHSCQFSGTKRKHVELFVMMRCDSFRPQGERHVISLMKHLLFKPMFMSRWSFMCHVLYVIIIIMQVNLYYCMSKSCLGLVYHLKALKVTRTST